MKIIAELWVLLMLSFTSLTKINGNRYEQDDITYNKLEVLPKALKVEKGGNFSLNVKLSGTIKGCKNISWISMPEVITTLPEIKSVCPTPSIIQSWNESFLSLKQGIVYLRPTVTPDDFINTDEASSKLYVFLENSILIISVIFGWIYVIAWDLSFLPQIYHNYKRKSVVGLSFDFLALNLIGFFCYSLFNIGLYWIPAIQEQYHIINPTSVLHVRLNDVIFPLYAFLCTVVQIGQCAIYPSGNQKVSWTCMIISSLLIITAIISIIMAATMENIWWIDVLYCMSYIKITISFIKYTPQLLTNYKLKSTEGWSIWQVSLDFVGGIFSLLQMLLLAYNFSDWHSILTDPAKLGLGLLSIFYNILFFIQHFCLYKKRELSVPRERKKIDNTIKKDDINYLNKIENQKTTCVRPLETPGIHLTRFSYGIEA